MIYRGASLHGDQAELQATLLSDSQSERAELVKHVSAKCDGISSRRYPGSGGC